MIPASNRKVIERTWLSPLRQSGRPDQLDATGSVRPKAARHNSKNANA